MYFRTKLEQMFEKTSLKTGNHECIICAFTCSAKSKYDRHITTAKHLKMVNQAEKVEKPPDELFRCIACNFVCKYKSDYDRHMLTDKHISKVLSNKTAQKRAQKLEESTTSYSCVCGNTYASRSALWYHKKRCDILYDIENTNKVNRIVPISQTFVTEAQVNSSDTDMHSLITTMIQSNAEVVQSIAAQAEAAHEQTRQLVEAISLKESQIINNNTTNNNQFNLNVFLNEDCKDAYTLKDVINTIECTVTDLDRMDKDGYAATVVRKIMESIQDMSITERPIHCTDARRNTVCVKNDTGWERNEVAMQILNNSVYKVGRLLGNVVDDWRDTYPDHFRGSDFRREQYHRLITNILKVSDGDIEARIVSKVCKGIVLDRKSLKN
jgi:hypothetical protein